MLKIDVTLNRVTEEKMDWTHLEMKDKIQAFDQVYRNRRPMERVSVKRVSFQDDVPPPWRRLERHDTSYGGRVAERAT